MINARKFSNLSGTTLALDLLLETIIDTQHDHSMTDKTWNAISRMIPGVTGKQCQARYEELAAFQPEKIKSVTGLSKAPDPCQDTGMLSTVNGGEEMVDTCNKKTKAEFGRAKTKPEVDHQKGYEGTTRPDSADQGPVMVIHVCDEAKNVQQDFQCPRDLLVREMRYFAEYLSTDAQRWEEVDISVHCDVQIFDWLMKYVKRSQKESADGRRPQLEATNVISILISSDFLKMDSLVDECIKFCHDHMSAIVGTPCNMNCINDKLTSRIADLFSHNEADDIKDRKDKFKSKIFAKKVEKIFDANINKDSPQNASTLYRCKFCKKLITKNLETKLPCIRNRLLIERFGGIGYSHQKDALWDVNDFLIDLKNELRGWREVYWRLWGTINFLTCSRCNEVFSASCLGHCRYHPESPKYEADHGTHPHGVYPCCDTKTLRFDPTQTNRGCKLRDHVVCLDNPTLVTNADHNTQECNVRVYDDLLARRDIICVPYSQPDAGPDMDTVDVFAQEEIFCGVRTDPNGHGSDSGSPLKERRHEVPRLQALTTERQMPVEDDEFDLSDDEVGDEEEPRGLRKTRVTLDPNAILVDAPDFTTSKSRKWDSTRSLRWNQDCQREEDQRRMKEIVTYLSRLRAGAPNGDRAPRLRDYSGGIFAKLEAQWKNANIPAPKAIGLQNRAKTKVSHMKPNS